MSNDVFEGSYLFEGKGLQFICFQLQLLCCSKEFKNEQEDIEKDIKAA